MPVSRQSRHFLFVDKINKVKFTTMYLDLACTELCLPPTKGYQ